MNIVMEKKIAVLISAGLIAFLGACSNGGSGGSSSGADEVTDTTAETLGSTTIVQNDFSFPEVAEANGGFELTIPDGPAPEFPARRELAAGTGSTIGFGDPVVLKYSMFSWSTGELVESTDDFDQAFSVDAGLSQGIPEYLSSSLPGRNVGDRLQLVFNAGMEDLPSYLDNTDAYVLVVDLL